MVFNFEQILSFLSVVLGLIATLILLAYNRAKDKNVNNFLLFTILPLTFLNLLTFLFASKLIVEYPHFLRINRPIFFLMGPGFYLYTLLILENRNKLVKKDYLHFIPFVLDFVIELPFYLSNVQMKQNIAQSIIANPSFIQSYGNCQVGGCWVIFTILFSICIYFVMSWKKYLLASKIENRLSASAKLIWVYRFLLFHSVLVFLCSLSLGFAFAIKGFVHLNILILSLALIAMVLMLFVNPTILYGINIEENANKTIVAIKKALQETLISEEVKNKYIFAIEEFLKDKNCVTELKLTLPQMAAKLGMQQHLLSALINQEYKTNFNDLINKHRTEIAKCLLADENFKCYSLEGIGSKAGFSSKTSFYTAFKKFTGYTPAEFAKRNS